MSTAIDVRRADSRPHTKIGWLDSHHSFSFGGHYDPDNTHHGLLLVSNDDRVAAGTGFSTHPHQDMEIVTWVLSGRLEHKDSEGNLGEIYPGLAQRMSAGTGIWHSEMNPSPAEAVHFIQMWVPPDTERIDPGYEQRDINAELDKGGLQPIASGQGHDAAIRIRQRDAVLWGGRLKPGEVVSIPDGGHAHLFVAVGGAALEGAGELAEGDAVRLAGAGSPKLTAGRDGAEVLVWGDGVSLLVLSQSDVASVLDMAQLTDAVEAAMVDLSVGRASVPPRVGAVVAERSAILAAMPAYLPSSAALTTKLVSVFPENRDRPTHQAVICCFDPQTGTPTAIMDGTLITAMRTAAGSALATRLLARANRAVAAIIGTGVQAETHVEALRAIGMSDFVVAGRDPDKVSAFAKEQSITAGSSIEDAVKRADVVCVTTHADAPVIAREWICPGTHINSVGYNTQGTGELDAATIRDAFVVVESRAAAFVPPPSGAVELRGVIEPDDAAEIGELPTRADDEQITVYKSVGVAVQDAAAATLVLAAARARGMGTEVAI